MKSLTTLAVIRTPRISRKFSNGGFQEIYIGASRFLVVYSKKGRPYIGIYDAHDDLIARLGF